jgi:hypothetical protein
LTRFWREIAADCRAGGMSVSSIRRLQRWLIAKNQADLLRKREGKGKSEAVFLATPGRFEDHVRQGGGNYGAVVAPLQAAIFGGAAASSARPAMVSKLM